MPKYEWEEMRFVLDDITTLPTLPTVMINAINIAFDPNSNIDTLYRLLKNDPAITAQILRIVNSSYYATSKNIESLKMALVILGLDEVVSIITAISMADTLQVLGQAEAFDLREFWIHSVVVGEIAHTMLEYVDTTTESELFTAGLLHDIGSILLATHFSEDYTRVHNIQAETGKALHVVEQELLGFDHTKIGEYLAQRWNLPESLQRAIRYHHEPHKDENPSIEIAMVYLADRFAHMRDVGVGEWSEDQSLKNDFAWETVSTLWQKHGKIPIDELAEQSVKSIEKARDKVQLMLF